MDKKQKIYRPLRPRILKFICKVLQCDLTFLGSSVLFGRLHPRGIELLPTRITRTLAFYWYSFQQAQGNPVFSESAFCRSCALCMYERRSEIVVSLPIADSNPAT